MDNFSGPETGFQISKHVLNVQNNLLDVAFVII